MSPAAGVEVVDRDYPAKGRSADREACQTDDRGAAAPSLSAAIAREPGHRLFFFLSETQNKDKQPAPRGSRGHSRRVKNSYALGRPKTPWLDEWGV